MNKKITMKKILITGGAGFIGTHLCRALVSRFDVTSFDLKDPTSPQEQLKKIDGVHYIQGDVRNFDVLMNVIASVDAVVHFAALVSIPLCQDDPLLSYQTNVMGTLNVLEAIRRKNLSNSQNKARIIFASSSAVYGEPLRAQGPLSEERESNPISIYGSQKLSSEEMIRLYHQLYGVSGVVFRFFNVYGKGQDPKSPYSGVMTVFKEALENKKPLTIFGDGLQVRDFISVHDIVKACEAALETSESHCDGSPINLGSGKELTIQSLAEKMRSLFSHTASSPIRYENPRTGDIEYSCAVIKKAQETLHWNPTFSIDEGLREFLK